jgi:hypothetical protein
MIVKSALTSTSSETLAFPRSMQWLMTKFRESVAASWTGCRT